VQKVARVAVILTLCLGATATSAPSPSSLSNRITVAVLPFEDRTTDPNLAPWRYVAQGLLKNQLGHVKSLRIRSEEAVRYAMRKTDHAAGNSIDPNRARTMGEYIETQRMIWGVVRRDATQWHFEVWMLNVATSELSGPFTATGADPFDLRDALNEQVLDELGIAPTEQQRQKMSERWTSSGEALSWYGKAYMLQEEGRPVAAVETCLRQALAADPNSATTCTSLAATLANRRDLGSATDLVRRALLLDDDHAEAHALLAYVLANQRRIEEAKDAARQACRKDPDSADHLVLLGRFLALEGKWDEAAGLLEIAVSLDPTDAVAHATLGEAHAARQDEQSALRELKEAVDYMPQRIAALNVHMKLAETYERMGRNPEAVDHYQQTVALATQLGMDPRMVQAIAARVQRVKSLLAPTFVEAAMPPRFTEAQLDAILVDRLTAQQQQMVGNPFSCNQAMRSWAHELTRDADSDIDKARAIFEGLAGRRSAAGQMRSRTATEVFDAWNDSSVRLVCMDHAVLFVALARIVDVNAFFVQVTRAPDGKAMNHACAAIFTEDRCLLADSSYRWFGVPHQEYVVLDDVQTAAFLCFHNRAADAHRLPVYQAGLKLWPQSVSGRLAVVGHLARTEQADEARRVFAEIPEPTSKGYDASQYFSAKGLLAAVDGDLEQAEELTRKAIALCSTEAGPHFALAQMCLKRGRLAEARATFRACLRNNPDVVMASLARQLIVQIDEEIGDNLPVDAAATESLSR
jgi:tetratricopeptide (TPR) repeat protein